MWQLGTLFSDSHDLSQNKPAFAFNAPAETASAFTLSNKNETGKSHLIQSSLSLFSTEEPQVTYFFPTSFPFLEVHKKLLQ